MSPYRSFENFVAERGICLTPAQKRLAELYFNDKGGFSRAIVSGTKIIHAAGRPFLFNLIRNFEMSLGDTTKRDTGLEALKTKGRKLWQKLTSIR